MSSISSLQKYYRQPKVYISLPSKGEYYPLGCLTGNSEQLPVYGMTGMDEILFKTPDALFTGESIVEVIKSCIPDIKDPWAMPQLDVDTALIAIRIATYGASLSVGFTCSKCNAENDRSFDLNQALAYFSSLYWENTIVLDPLIIYLKPFNYKQNTEFQLKNYELQKMLANSARQDNEEVQRKILTDFYKKLSIVQAESFKLHIDKIEADDDVVNNPQEINDWLNNSDKEIFDKLKKHLENMKNIWKIPTQKTECASCSFVNEVSINLDNSNFFVNN